MSDSSTVTNWTNAQWKMPNSYSVQNTVAFIQDSQFAWYKNGLRPHSRVGHFNEWTSRRTNTLAHDLAVSRERKCIVKDVNLDDCHAIHVQCDGARYGVGVVGWCWLDGTWQNILECSISHVPSQYMDMLNSAAYELRAMAAAVILVSRVIGKDSATSYSEVQRSIADILK